MVKNKRLAVVIGVVGLLGMSMPAFASPGYCVGLLHELQGFQKTMDAAANKARVYAHLYTDMEDTILGIMVRGSSGFCQKWTADAVANGRNARDSDLKLVEDYNTSLDAMNEEYTAILMQAAKCLADTPDAQ